MLWMFRLLQEIEFEQLIHQNPQINITRPEITCFTCIEKGSLLDQINDLNTVIANLQDRIHSLTQIRAYENDIDDLSAQFAGVTLGLSNTTIPPETGAEVTVPPCPPQLSSTITMSSTVLSADSTLNNTSVWSNTEVSQTDHIGVHQKANKQYQQPEVLGKILNCIKERTSVITPVADMSGETKESTSTISDCPKHAKLKEVMNKFSQNNTVKTFLCGGRELKGISINPTVLKSEEGFKIANSKCTLAETIDTANFFMNTVHQDIQNVILQVGTNHIKRGHSEIIKDALINFASQMAQQNIDVIISGPIPYSKLSGESFSRLCGINDWLIKYSSDKHTFQVIDNIDFLKNEYLFSPTGGELSETGSFTLRERMAKMLIDTRAE